jgi:hypothetical protein
MAPNMNPIEYIEYVAKEIQNPKFVTLKKRLEAHLASNTDDFLVGRSLCIQLDLPRWGNLDSTTHVGLVRAVGSKQRRRYAKFNKRIYRLKAYTILEGLLPLLRQDCPISLMMTYNDALHKEFISFEAIDARLRTQFPGKVMMKKIRPYLRSDLESNFETLFYLKCQMLGYADLEVQLTIGKMRPDFKYGDVVFELDGMGKYSGKYNRETIEQIKHDAGKSNEYQVLGNKAFRLFWEDLYNGNLERYLGAAGVTKVRRHGTFYKIVEDYLIENGRQSPRESIGFNA